MRETKDYDKNTIYLPRQESGVQGISWYSVDNTGHIFPCRKCRTTERLRMTEGKTTGVEGIVVRCGEVSLNSVAIVRLFQ